MAWLKADNSHGRLVVAYIYPLGTCMSISCRNHSPGQRRVVRLLQTDGACRSLLCPAAY
jgi:hypothetical protein